MNAEKIAKENKILEFPIGSRLYGTDTSDSDEDYSGVFMPNDEMVFGFHRAEEVDMSVKSKRPDGRNTKDAVDVKFYEIRKFVRLALDNNPNVIEMMFIPEDKLIFADTYGKLLLSKAPLFPHQGLKKKFVAYANSQKHKMVIRSENFKDLQDAMGWFEENVKTLEDEKRLIAEFLSNLPEFMNIKGDNIKIGDLSFQKHVQLRKVKRMVADRLSKATNRKNLLEKYGYDVKFASHLVRLMLEGKELLLTGKLEFPLRYAQTILDIKLGKWEMEDVIKYADEAEQEVNGFSETTFLPKEPNREIIYGFAKELLKEYLAGT